MWFRLSNFILKNRLAIIICVLACSGVMAYVGQSLQWSFKLLQIVPDNDPDLIAFQEFESRFGEDANAMVVGIKDSSIYSLDNFQQLSSLSDDLHKVDGIAEVVSLPRLLSLSVDRVNKKFNTSEIFKAPIASQKELDSLLVAFKDIQLYKDVVYNSENGALISVLVFEKGFVDSPKRLNIVDTIVSLGNKFEKETGIELRYSGLPFIRSTVAKKTKAETIYFLWASIIVSAFVLFLFFRSFSPVFYPLIIIGMVILWTMGILSLLEYKVSLLTGLLPPVMVVIGIPNCIYFLNKYHQEFYKIKDRHRALRRVIRKIGPVAFITNSTTAIGFLVLLFTGIKPLQEFGLVAGINIMVTFVISLLFIPTVFSYLPDPKTRNIRHIYFKPTQRLIGLFAHWAMHKRKVVYTTVSIIVLASLYGITQVDTVSYMVDDLPEDGQVVKDLRFFEENFQGVMPLEIIVDTGRKKGIRKGSFLRKVDELSIVLDSIPEISQPISIVSLLKAANQAYFSDPRSFSLPSNRDGALLQRYLLNSGEGKQNPGILVDSLGRYIRVSTRIADIGSNKMNSIIQNKIEPAIASIFDGTDLKASITGTTLIFIKGNSYLVKNLRNSLFIAFFLIAIIMALLFRNGKIVIVSLLPNIVPLLITAGIMGYFGIPLKPSTALVFSIAFGIAVDDSIHFLAKFRQELYVNDFNILKAIQTSFKETGMSMIYTSIVLFFGFITFTFSGFGGTIALGLLTSITLFFAMVTNLVFLPSLILSFEKRKSTIYRKKDTVKIPVR